MEKPSKETQIFQIFRELLLRKEKKNPRTWLIKSKNVEYELAAEISDNIEKFLQKINRQSAENIQKSIDKSSLIAVGHHTGLPVNPVFFIHHLSCRL